MQIPQSGIQSPQPIIATAESRTKLPPKGWKKGISSHLSSHTMSEKFADGYTLVTLGIKKAFRLGKANKVKLLK